jgi:hypothetical protein
MKSAKIEMGMYKDIGQSFLDGESQRRLYINSVGVYYFL